MPEQRQIPTDGIRQSLLTAGWRETDECLESLSFRYYEGGMCVARLSQHLGEWSGHGRLKLLAQAFTLIEGPPQAEQREIKTAEELLNNLPFCPGLSAVRSHIDPEGNEWVEMSAPVAYLAALLQPPPQPQGVMVPVELAKAAAQALIDIDMRAQSEQAIARASGDNKTSAVWAYVRTIAKVGDELAEFIAAALTDPRRAGLGHGRALPQGPG